MCKVSEKYIHWCWDIYPDRQKFSNILSIWANKNGDKSAILKFDPDETIHRIYGRMLVNACVEYQEEMFIGVGDIHPDGQHFRIFYQFDQTKIGISRPFSIWSWRNFTEFMGWL